MKNDSRGINYRYGDLSKLMDYRDEPCRIPQASIFAVEPVVGDWSMIERGDPLSFTSKEIDDAVRKLNEGRKRL